MSNKIKFVKLDNGVILDYGILKDGEITWESDGFVTPSKYIHGLYQSGDLVTISEEEFQNNLEKSPEQISDDCVANIDSNNPSESVTSMLNKVLSIVERIENKVDNISGGIVDGSEGYTATLHTKEIVMPHHLINQAMTYWNNFINQFTHSVTLTENQKRANLIKEAKELTTAIIENHKSGGRNSVIRFTVDSDNGIVYANENGIFFPNYFMGGQAIATCNPNDVFNADIGKLIAVSRLLNVEIDPKFFDAPQPTEYVNGMHVTFPKEHKWHRQLVVHIDKINELTTPDGTIIIDKTNVGSNSVGEKVTNVEKSKGASLPIIDDTNAVYKENDEGSVIS